MEDGRTGVNLAAVKLHVAQPPEDLSTDIGRARTRNLVIMVNPATADQLTEENVTTTSNVQVFILVFLSIYRG